LAKLLRGLVIPTESLRKLQRQVIQNWEETGDNVKIVAFSPNSSISTFAASRVSDLEKASIREQE
jgi:hypothetical protein